jgi:hypothetical protein
MVSAHTQPRHAFTAGGVGVRESVLMILTRSFSVLFDVLHDVHADCETRYRTT